jgi:hypothetical protein
LWSDFKFLVIKLNFSRVKLSLPDGCKEWQRESTQFPPAQVRHFRLEFGEDNCMSLDLEMEAGADDERVFSNLCDITCEAWQNAAARWMAVNQIPVRFKSCANTTSPDPKHKGNRPYVPLPPGQTSGVEQSF